MPALSCSHASDRGPRWGDTRPPAACARMGIAARSCLRPTCGVPGDAPMGVVRDVHRWVPIPCSVPRRRVGQRPTSRARPMSSGATSAPPLATQRPAGPAQLGEQQRRPASPRPADLGASARRRLCAAFVLPSRRRAASPGLRHGFESDALAVGPYRSFFCIDFISGGVLSVCRVCRPDIPEFEAARRIDFEVTPGAHSVAPSRLAPGSTCSKAGSMPSPPMPLIVSRNSPKISIFFPAVPSTRTTHLSAASLKMQVLVPAPARPLILVALILRAFALAKFFAARQRD